jgi:hypothetical protein
MERWMVSLSSPRIFMRRIFMCVSRLTRTAPVSPRYLIGGDDCCATSSSL